MANIICHQNRTSGKSMCRDHHVQYANERAGGRKLMPNFSIRIRLRVPGQPTNNLQRLLDSDVQPAQRGLLLR